MMWLFALFLVHPHIVYAFQKGEKQNDYSTKTCSGDEFRFSNLYQDRMVLQRAPESATIWGYGVLPEGADATVTCSTDSKILTTFISFPFKEDDGMWKLELQPQTGGTVCKIEINVGCGGQISINEVIFGDVYLCSGQSNMQSKMAEMAAIFNATEEIEYSKIYTDIRFTRVPPESAWDHDDKLDINLEHGWTDASDKENLRHMSAVCFLYGRNIYDKLGVPLGLISSSYPNSPIESWSSLDMLGVCGIESQEKKYELDGTNCKGCLYNKMIYPLRKNTLKGFLWYQGERNAAYNRDLYNCTFPAKINGWRSVFSSNSNTNSNAPYGFVQLSTIKYGETDLGTPLIRWHQTADWGYVPNDDQYNVFMAVAIDTYDGQIHPRYKQIVGERLATAGMNVVYGDKSFPTNGPMVAFPETLPGPILSLVYTEQLTYNNEEISGFYYCCTDYDDCDRGSNKNWLEIGKDLVELVNDINGLPNTINIKVGELIACEMEVPHIAYLWRDTPVKNYLGAPIYSKYTFWPSYVGLPSAPFKMHAPKR